MRGDGGDGLGWRMVRDGPGWSVVRVATDTGWRYGNTSVFSHTDVALAVSVAQRRDALVCHFHPP